VAGVAAAAQHQRLPVAADVAHQLDALRRAHQRPALAFLRQGVVVAHLGHRQRVPQVARAVLEDQFKFAPEQLVRKVGVTDSCDALRNALRIETMREARESFETGRSGPT
jgi:hypothetical protein